MSHDLEEGDITLFSIYTHFNTLKKTVLGQHCGQR